MRRPKAQRVEIAKRFDMLTEALGISTKDLLVSSGVSMSKEYRCGGDHSISGSLCDNDINKICTAHKVSFEWLINGTGQMFVQNNMEPVSHCFNIFIKEENGTFRHLKTCSHIDDALIYLLIMEKEKKEARKRTIVIETDIPITIYKKLVV